MQENRVLFATKLFVNALSAIAVKQMAKRKKDEKDIWHFIGLVKGGLIENDEEVFKYLPQNDKFKSKLFEFVCKSLVVDCNNLEIKSKAIKTSENIWKIQNTGLCDINEQLRAENKRRTERIENKTKELAAVCLKIDDYISKDGKLKTEIKNLKSDRRPYIKDCFHI